MELTYLTVCTQNTKNIIIKISMLIRCIFEYLQKKRKVLMINVINSNINLKMFVLVFIYKKWFRNIVLHM